MSLASNPGVSHAGISTAFGCLLTQVIGQEAAPHISGIDALHRKLLIPKGTSQYVLHVDAEVSICALRSQRSPASAPGSHILDEVSIVLWGERRLRYLHHCPVEHVSRSPRLYTCLAGDPTILRRLHCTTRPHALMTRSFVLAILYLELFGIEERRSRSCTQ